jgi:hypothetical protein
MKKTKAAEESLKKWGATGETRRWVLARAERIARMRGSKVLGANHIGKAISAYGAHLLYQNKHKRKK